MKLFALALIFTLITIAQNNDPVMATEDGEVGMFALVFWGIFLHEHKNTLKQWFAQHRLRLI